MRHTASAMLELPLNLAPLLRPEPHLDVLGTCDPWVVPADWLETTQQKMKALAEDPRGQGGVPPSRQLGIGYVGRGAVPLEPHHLPAERDPGLGGQLRQPRRPAAQAVAVGHLRARPSPGSPTTSTATTPGTSTCGGASATSAPRPASRRWSSRIECVAVFAEVPQYAPRAATFTAMLHQVLDDPELRKLHEEAAVGRHRPRPGASRSAPSRTPRPSPRGAAGPPSWCGRSAASTPRTRCSATWSAGPSRPTR